MSKNSNIIMLLLISYQVQNKNKINKEQKKNYKYSILEYFHFKYFEFKYFHLNKIIYKFN